VTFPRPPPVRGQGGRSGTLHAGDHEEAGGCGYARGMTSAQGPRHLQTERLDLRALTPGDLGALHPIISDPLNCVHIPEGPMESLEDSRAWIERFSARWEVSGLGYWTARLRATSAVIGVGGAERRPRYWNLFYLLDRRDWGNGYGTELARAAQREAAAADPGLPVVAWIHEENLASQAVARHLGLTDHGHLEPQHWAAQPMHCWADRQPFPAR
jgi:RimJ/RimL family protein N-acetyltransferase